MQPIIKARQRKGGPGEMKLQGVMWIQKWIVFIIPFHAVFVPSYRFFFFNAKAVISALGPIFQWVNF